MVSARWQTIHACDGYEKARYPLSAIGSGAAGYDTHYDGKWHITHADLLNDNGEPLPTNTADGDILHDNVDRYLDANPLDPFGFSVLVGPEPHGGLFANCGLARDPLIAARVVRWLNDRYERRRNGDADALKPFLLVASFVNPHDIVLFPLWIQRGMPGDLNDIEVPDVPMSPSDFEDLRHKPAAQVAYRAPIPRATDRTVSLLRSTKRTFRNIEICITDSTKR